MSRTVQRSYTVTRQSNYYDEGAYSVEIAYTLDYAGPGALAQKYLEDFAQYDDPREAAEAAIKLRRQWVESLTSNLAEWFRANERIRFTLAMNSVCYPTVNDAMSASELRRWARAEYDRLPKCDHCGTIASSEDNYMDEFGDNFTACCSSHADEIVWQWQRENEECEIDA